MPPVETLGAFFVASVVMGLAPGPDILFVLTQSALYGARAGFATTCGLITGLFVHITAVSLGVAALFQSSETAFNVLKFAGAAYLLYLAWKSWNAGPVDPHAQAARGPWNIIRRGALSNILNPKPVLFLLAFLPQFTNPAYGPIWQQILGLGLIFAFTGTLVTIGYGVVAGYVGHMLGKRLGLLNKIAAVMFAGLAIRLVVK